MEVTLYMYVLPMTMQQFRGVQQLHPVGLATVICQVSDTLELGMVWPPAAWPGPSLPNIPFLSLFYVSMDVIIGLLTGL
jgi:hypothetical protein